MLSLWIPSVRIENLRMIIVFRVVAKSHNASTQDMPFWKLIRAYLYIFACHPEQDSDCRRPHSQTFIHKLASKFEFLHKSIAYLKIIISHVFSGGQLLFNLFLNPCSILRVLSKAVQRKCCQMACRINTSEIKRYQLMHYLLNCHSADIMRFSQLLSFFDLLIGLSHDSDVMAKEILLFVRPVFLAHPGLENLSDYFPDFNDLILKSFILH